MSTARSQNVESSYWIQVRRKSVWLLAGRVVAVSCMLLDCRLTIEWFLVLCCSVPCACARGDVWQIYFYQSRVSCWCNLDVTAVTSCPASCLHQLITDVHVCVSLPYGTTALHLALALLSCHLHLPPAVVEARYPQFCWFDLETCSKVIQDDAVGPKHRLPISVL